MTDPTGVAAGLSEAQRDFLERVATGRQLKSADRAEDRARQSMRRLGLVKVAKNPRRWVVTELGLLTRQSLTDRDGEG